MADIRLGRQEIENYYPPPVCARCGARAVLREKHRFRSSPPWIIILLPLGVLPYLIAAAMTVRVMTVSIPLCARHKWHWVGRNLVIFLGLIAIILITILTLMVRGAYELKGWFVFIPVGSLVLAWIATAVALASTGIRPSEITEMNITLSGVSPIFIEAINEARRGERDKDPRRSRRRRDADDEEDGWPGDERRGTDDAGDYNDPDEENPRRRPPDAIEEGEKR